MTVWEDVAAMYRTLRVDDRPRVADIRMHSATVEWLAVKLDAKVPDGEPQPGEYVTLETQLFGIRVVTDDTFRPGYWEGRDYPGAVVQFGHFFQEIDSHA